MTLTNSFGLGAQFEAAAIVGLPENHWSLTDDDLGKIFETMCNERPWLDQLAEDGPMVQIVDRYAAHTGEFVTWLSLFLTTPPKRTMKWWCHSRTEAS